MPFFQCLISKLLSVYYMPAITLGSRDNRWKYRVSIPNLIKRQAKTKQTQKPGYLNNQFNKGKYVYV